MSSCGVIDILMMHDRVAVRADVVARRLHHFMATSEKWSPR